MSKLIMMRGLPASGKSTRAKELIKEYVNFVRVSRDNLREMLHFNNFNHHNEGITIEVQKVLVRNLLLTGQNVIVDDTSLGKEHEARWSGIAGECEAKFEVVDTDRPWRQCIEWDSGRPNPVGKSVVVQMALRYGLFSKDKPIVLCDIDGTLADISHRLHHVQKDPKDWRAFFDAIEHDLLREDVYRLARERATNGYLILVSARPDNFRKETEAWLERVGVVYDALIMRRAGDRRPDTEVKEQMFETMFKDYPIEVVYDDRPRVIAMWRAKGLEVVDVGDGADF